MKRAALRHTEIYIYICICIMYINDSFLGSSSLNNKTLPYAENKNSYSILNIMCTLCTLYSLFHYFLPLFCEHGLKELLNDLLA